MHPSNCLKAEVWLNMAETWLNMAEVWLKMAEVWLKMATDEANYHINNIVMKIEVILSDLI